MKKLLPVIFASWFFYFSFPGKDTARKWDGFDSQAECEDTRVEFTDDLMQISDTCYFENDAEVDAQDVKDAMQRVRDALKNWLRHRH